jgi:hypothetical protein
MTALGRYRPFKTQKQPRTSARICPAWRAKRHSNWKGSAVTWLSHDKRGCERLSPILVVTIQESGIALRTRCARLLRSDVWMRLGNCARQQSHIATSTIADVQVMRQACVAVDGIADGILSMVFRKLLFIIRLPCDSM